MATEQEQQPIRSRSMSPDSLFVPEVQREAHLKPEKDENSLDSAQPDLGGSYVLALRDIKAKCENALTEMRDSKTVSGDGTTPPSVIPAKRKASEMGTDLDVEDDDESDDEDDVLPHDPASEPLPRLPVYHPGFALTEQTAKRTLDVFKKFLKKSKYSDDEAKHLVKEIEAHEKIPYGDAVRIGLIGDAGVGKSSAINSILGVANLTVEGDDGDSCTYVVIEFVQSELTQTTPYSATIEFFSTEVCFRMITELLAQYVHHMQKVQEDSDEPDDMETENASTARECFQVLFAGHAEFADEDAAEAFLSTAKAPNDPLVLNKLMRWTKSILNNFVKDGKSFVTLGSDTAEGLVEKFVPFTRQVQYASFNGKPLTYSPWPLVRLIRVSLDSPILRQGIILADLPGISDINRFRVDAAMRYMQGCDMTVVVAKIDRPEKSAQFKNQYLEAFRRRRSGSVIMLITRSDDLNLEGKTNIEPQPEDEDRLQLIASKTAALDKKLDANRLEMERNRTGKKSRLNKELKKQNAKLSQRKKALIQEKLEIRIAARNRKVANTLAQNYRLDTRDDVRVPVFCVSNKSYMHHMRGYEKDDPPAMGLAETQVPLLRSFIYALPSKGKFATLDHYCNVSFQKLLSIMQMSCSTTTLARKDHLIGIVVAVQENIRKQIHTLTLKFSQTEAKELIDALSVASQDSIQWKFLRQALIQCKKYAKMHPAGHRAFIRHEGDYRTKSAGAQNWNEDFLKPIRDGIDRAFARLHDEACETFKAEVAQAIKENITELNNKLKNDPQALVCDAYKECFLDNLDRYEAEITASVEEFSKGLQKNFRKIHQKACLGGEGHYFTEAMSGIYEACDITRATGKGKTLHKSRCELFEAKVCSVDTSPYRSIPDGVHKSVTKALSRTARLLQNEISTILGQIQRDFERMAVNKNNDSAEGKAFRKSLHELVKEAKEIFNGPVKDSTNLCRHYK